MEYLIVIIEVIIILMLIMHFTYNNGGRTIPIDKTKAFGAATFKLTVSNANASFVSPTFVFLDDKNQEMQPTESASSLAGTEFVVTHKFAYPQGNIAPSISDVVIRPVKGSSIVGGFIEIWGDYMPLPSYSAKINSQADQYDLAKLEWPYII